MTIAPCLSLHPILLNRNIGFVNSPQMLNHVDLTCKHFITPRDFAIDGLPELMHRLTVTVEAMLGSESSRARFATTGNTKSLPVTFACVRATVEHHVFSIRMKGYLGVYREKGREGRYIKPPLQFPSQQAWA